jgi:hypothetical protein
VQPVRMDNAGAHDAPYEGASRVASHCSTKLASPGKQAIKEIKARQTVLFRSIDTR